VKDLDPCWRYQRACSLYYEVYPLPIYRDLIGRFIAFLEREYKSHLGDLPTSKLTAMQIGVLHTGVGSDILIEQLSQNLVVNLEGRRSVIYDPAQRNTSLRNPLRSSLQLQSLLQIPSCVSGMPPKKSQGSHKSKKPIVVVRAAPIKKKGKNAKKKAARKAAMGSQELILSNCGVDYAKCLLNPCGAPPSCMPTIGGCQSRKVKVMLRGGLACSSTTGLGCLIVNPLQGITSDLPWAYFSDTPFVGTVLPSTTGTGVISGFSNSDYQAAAFSTLGASMRLVSLCLRVRYVGTELNRGGAIYALSEPDHVGLNGKSIAQLRAYNACSESPVTEDWTELCYLGPVNPTEFEYVSTFGATIPNSNLMMAFFIKCPVSSNSVFDFEVYGNYEVIGPNVNGKTPSFADPTGMAIVTGGAMQAGANGQIGHHGSTAFAKKAVSAMGTAAQMALSFVGTKGAALGVGALSRELIPFLAKRAFPALGVAAGMLM